MATKPEEYLGIKDYKVVGTRPIRHDGVDKVTGRARYGADAQVAGVLQGKTLRSPHAHARILSIDTSGAEALEGVKAVITGRDLMHPYEDKVASLGEGSVSLKHLITNVLAVDKVLYEGPASTVMVGTTPYYGYGMKVLPFASRYPSMFQVRIADLSVRRVARILPAVWNGTYHGHDIMDFAAESVRVTFDRPTPYQVAGDGTGEREDLTFSIAPQPLRLIRLI